MVEPHRFSSTKPRRIGETEYREGRLQLLPIVRERPVLWSLGLLVLLPVLGFFFGWLSVQLGW